MNDVSPDSLDYVRRLAKNGHWSHSVPVESCCFGTGVYAQECGWTSEKREDWRIVVARDFS